MTSTKFLRISTENPIQLGTFNFRIILTFQLHKIKEVFEKLVHYVTYFQHDYQNCLDDFQNLHLQM